MPTEPIQKPSRRDFIKLATTGMLTGAGLMGLGGLLRFLNFESEPPRSTVVDVGSVSQYQVGSSTILADIPAMLTSREGGFTALSLVCTHLGCTVEQRDGGFRCPCHGSRYDAQGNVQKGPARENLKQLKVQITNEGHVLVHRA